MALFCNYFTLEAFISDHEKLFKYIKQNDIAHVESYLNLYPEKLEKLRNPYDFIYSSTTPLQYACEEDKFEIIKLLVERGASVNNYGNSSWSPLLTTLERNNPNRLDIAYYLIENNAEVTKMTRINDSVLGLVLRNTNYNSVGQQAEIDFVMFLFENNYFDYLDETKNGILIHNAATWNNVFLLDYMLNLGVDVNIKGAYNRTPLMESVFLSSKEALLYLLDRGADKQLVDLGGKTALDIAIDHKDQEIIDILKK
jgi:ankyrin repeat protein